MRHFHNGVEAYLNVVINTYEISHIWVHFIIHHLSRIFKLRTRNQNARPKSTTIYTPDTICTSYVYAIYRGSQDGLDSQWWLVSQVLEVETEVWKYSRLWTCNASWVKEMQESHNLDWWFWDESVCFLVLAHRWPQVGYHLGNVWRVFPASSKWSLSKIWPAYKLLPG